MKATVDADSKQTGSALTGHFIRYTLLLPSLDTLLPSELSLFFMVQQGVLNIPFAS